MQLRASIHNVLPEGDAPEWVHLLPAGTFRGVDGRGPYVLHSPQAVIQASKLPLPIDESHATDLAEPHGGPAPARGWIVELQAREDGVWGRVDWTPTGRGLVVERAYRGISPVFTHARQGGRVVGLVRAALTNNPNLNQLTTLHTQEHSMDFIAQLRTLHSLPAEADEAAVLQACRAAHTATTQHAAQLAAICAAAGITATQDAAAISTALATARAQTGDVAPLRQEVVALQTQLQTVRAEQARGAATALVDAAMKAGKPITQVLRDHYIARATADLAAVQRELDALPSINAGGIVKPPAEGAKDAVSAEEKAVLALMGVDPEAFKKARAAEQQETV